MNDMTSRADIEIKLLELYERSDEEGKLRIYVDLLGATPFDVLCAIAKEKPIV